MRSLMKVDLQRLTPLQRSAMQELVASQVMAGEILARAAWFAHTTLPTGLLFPYRNQAHRLLAEILDEVELSMSRCQGRA
jgi:hypothetical protein